MQQMTQDARVSLDLTGAAKGAGLHQAGPPQPRRETVEATGTCGRGRDRAEVCEGRRRVRRLPSHRTTTSMRSAKPTNASCRGRGTDANSFISRKHGGQARPLNGSSADARARDSSSRGTNHGETADLHPERRRARRLRAAIAAAAAPDQLPDGRTARSDPRAAGPPLEPAAPDRRVHRPERDHPDGGHAQPEDGPPAPLPAARRSGSTCRRCRRGSRERSEDPDGGCGRSQHGLRSLQPRRLSPGRAKLVRDDLSEIRKSRRYTAALQPQRKPPPPTFTSPPSAFGPSRRPARRAC